MKVQICQDVTSCCECQAELDGNSVYICTFAGTFVHNGAQIYSSKTCVTCIPCAICFGKIVNIFFWFKYDLASIFLLQVAIDSATPVDDAGPSGSFMMNSVGSFGGYGGPMRTYGRMYGSLDFDDVSIYTLMILLTA